MKNIEQRLTQVAAAFVGAGFTIDYSPNGNKIYGEMMIDGCEANIEYDSLMSSERIWIESLETPLAKRGNGAATRMLQRIFNLGDELGMPVMLEAVPIGKEIRMTVDQLVGWYERRGFVVVKHFGHFCDMARPVRELATS